MFAAKTIFASPSLNTLPSLRKTRVSIAHPLQSRNSHIFYEYAFDALVKMEDHDIVGMLLSAVIALEGAHAAFCRLALRETMKHLNDKTFDSLIDRMLINLGTMTIYEMTPFLFMTDAERPTLDELKACKKGSTIRNDIMHSSSKGGKYNLRNRESSDIYRAGIAVLAVYDRFVAAIESRIDAQPQLVDDPEPKQPAKPAKSPKGKRPKSQIQTDPPES